MALRQDQLLCAKQKQEEISAFFDRELSSQTVELLVHGGFTVSVFQQLRKHELPTFYRCLSQLHIKLSDHERLIVEGCAQRNCQATPRPDKVHGGFPHRDEQEHVTRRQRQPGVSAQNRYSSQYFPEEDFGGQELDVEAGMPLCRENEKGPNPSEDSSVDQPLMSSGVGDQIRCAGQDLLAETDSAAREIDRLNMQAAAATRELESILKWGASGKPRRRRTSSSRILCVGL